MPCRCVDHPLCQLMALLHAAAPVPFCLQSLNGKWRFCASKSVSDCALRLALHLKGKAISSILANWELEKV